MPTRTPRRRNSPAFASVETTLPVWASARGIPGAGSTITGEGKTAAVEGRLVTASTVSPGHPATESSATGPASGVTAEGAYRTVTEEDDLERLLEELLGPASTEASPKAAASVPTTPAPRVRRSPPSLASSSTHYADGSKRRAAPFTPGPPQHREHSAALLKPTVAVVVLKLGGKTLPWLV